MKTTSQTQNYSLILINKFGEQTIIMNSDNFKRLQIMSEGFNESLSSFEKKQFGMEYIVVMQF